MEINTSRPSAEAVNIAASSAQSTRFNERRQREAQSDVRNDAVFYSPVVKIDTETRAVVLQYRDENTGEVKSEYPNNQKINAYQQAQPKEVKAPEQPEKAEVKAVEVPEVKVDEEA